MRKIFSLMAAMLFAWSLSAETIYCKVDQTWWLVNDYGEDAAVAAYCWKDGGAKVAAWPGTRMTAVAGETHVWSIDIDKTVADRIIFVRVPAAGEMADWGAKTANLEFEEGKNLYTITSESAVWGDPGVAGAWSVFTPSEQGGEEEPVVVEHTYTVAGDSKRAFGAEWSATATANDMTKQEDGTYKWEKTEVTLAVAGSIKFKVCEDHAWAVSYPASDYVLTIPAAGVYTITITFNPAAAEDKVAATADKTGDADVLPTVQVHGNFTDEWADSENFTVADDKATATLKMTLTKGNYEFGLKLDGSWTSTGASYNRNSVVAGTGNMKLEADADGEYTFVWTFATNTLAITFPDKEEVGPVLANGYYLIADPWSIESLSDDVLFEANPGAEGEYMLNTTLTEGQAIKVVEVENNAIKTWYPDGEGNEFSVTADYAGEKDIYFRPAGKEDWSAFGGYIYIEKNASTGIDATVDGAKAVKVLRDGMLLIEKGGKTYNVLGTIVR